MIEVDTSRADGAGIEPRSKGGRSYFARVKGEAGPAPVRLWTDEPYAKTLKEFKTHAAKTLKRRNIIIEVGPPGRRVS